MSYFDSHTPDAMLDRPIATKAGCLPSLYRALFVQMLFFVIALPKLLQQTQSGGSEMDSLSAIYTLLVAIGVCLLLSLLFVAFSMLRIVAFPRMVDTSSGFIAPASIVWFIPNLFGWMFVREGEQVGVVGSHILKHAGFFVYWPFRPARMNILSIQERSETIEVDEITQDGSRIKLTVKIKYRVRPSKAAQIVRQSAEPYETFCQSLKATVEGFIRSNSFEMLYSSPSLIHQRLDEKFRNRLSMYQIATENAKPAGARVDKRDDMAQEQEKIAVAIVDAKCKELSIQPDLRGEIIKKALDIYGVAAIAGGKDVTDFLMDVKNLWADRNVGTPLSAINILPSTPTRSNQISLASLIEPPLRLLAENPPEYSLVYHEYRIFIDLTSFPPKALMNIYTPTNQTVFSGEVSLRKVEHVLSCAKQLIEEDLDD